MFLHFDDAARLVMRLADLEARWYHHDFIATEHLLLALAQLHDCVAARVLARAGIDLEHVRIEVERRVPLGPGDGRADRRPLTPGVRKAIEHAVAAADRLGHGRVGTGHLLLGLLEEAKGAAFRVLVKLGIGRLGKNLSAVAVDVVAEMKGERKKKARDGSANAIPGLFPKMPAQRLHTDETTAGRRSILAGTACRGGILAGAARGALAGLCGSLVVVIPLLLLSWYEEQRWPEGVLVRAGWTVGFWTACMAVAGWWHWRRG